jgi:diaminopimelate epimerase
VDPVRIPFTKMHGAGNDFVVVNCLDESPVEDWGAFAVFALDRRRGVGGDQLLLVQPPGDRRDADFFMGIRNPDGSVAEMCANGIRAFYKYARDHGLTDDDRIRVETLGGIVTPCWLGEDLIQIEMMRPVFEPEKIPTMLRSPDGHVPLVEVPLEVAGQQLLVTTLSMGNPHCVIFVDDPEDAPLEELGPLLENHAVFPERTNVEFISVRDRDVITQRTWERGTGETLACGSGACAAAVAGVLTGRSSREVEIQLRGGTLRIRWPRDEGPVWLTGPATHVFEGELEVP